MSASVADNRHGADEDWLDFARALGDPARHAALQAHLQTGCAPCADALAFWRSVIVAADRDNAIAPPDWLLRQAKGTFSLHASSTRRPVLASLVFDSFHQPTAAGVRATTTAGPRQMLFRAGRYLVRVRAEEAGNAGTSLIGQVVDEELDGAFLPDVTVMAFAGKEAIDQTVTNRLGEFAFETVPAGNVQLAIGLADNGFLTVALPVAPRREEGSPARAKRLNWK